MINSIIMKIKIPLLLLGFTVFINLASVKSQTATDGFYMNKGNMCIVVDYSHDGWNKYWEGKKKRESHYVGTFSSNAVGGMIGLGITDDILFTAGLPYIWTSSSEFYGSGQSGFQDLSLGLKWRAYRKKVSAGYLSLQPSVTTSLPVSDYIPDALPFSIGLHTKTFGANGIVNYMSDKNFFINFNWGYQWRSNIEIDAESYWYNDQLYYTNEMYIPDLILYGVRMGYDVERFRAEAWLSVQTAQGGSDIRLNDKPYPCNKMNYTKAGVAGKYNLKKIPGLSLNASIGLTPAGRNVGEAFSYNAGVQYILKTF
jgi:hypothetical protein